MANSMDVNFIVDEIDGESDDITFILGPDGQLKHLLIPEELLDNLPLEVQNILEILGIDDFSQLNCKTIH